MTLAVIGAPACNRSVYHHAREQLPASPTERIALRIREARDAAHALLSPSPATKSPSPGSDLDGLAWDFSRRVSALEDVLGRNNEGAAADVLRTMRTAEAAVQAALDSSTKASWNHATEALQAAITVADTYRPQ